MMESKRTVSIIIPVYNSKEKLAECLESVVNQTYPQMEVIVVDDCSTDGSLEICREYEEKHPCLHVYTKENEGVSAARNYGLAKATGDYIQFVDSDDKLYPEATAHLVARMEQDQSDLVIGGYWNEKENREVVYPDKSYGERKGFMKEFPTLFTRFFIHVPWNKLYRRSALGDVTFPRDLNKGEDLLFNLQVLKRTEKISILKEVLYFYHNISDTSLSFRFREDAMEIEERLYREVRKFWQENEMAEEPIFLYLFYLTAIKNKCYALVGKSGYPKSECKKQLEKWCQMESVRELCGKAKYFGRKDQVLLALMKRGMAGLLLSYYEWAAKK
nr:glycosyltransferase [Eubacterium sp.]